MARLLGVSRFVWAMSFFACTRCAVLQVNNNPFMLIFGAFQLLLSQIPDFDRLWFLSILAAVMSFSYASIGFGLAVGKATGICCNSRILSYHDL